MVEIYWNMLADYYWTWNDWVLALVDPPAVWGCTGYCEAKKFIRFRLSRLSKVLSTLPVEFPDIYRPSFFICINYFLASFLCFLFKILSYGVPFCLQIFDNCFFIDVPCKHEVLLEVLLARDKSPGEIMFSLNLYEFRSL